MPSTASARGTGSSCSRGTPASCSRGPFPTTTHHPTRERRMAEIVMGLGTSHGSQVSLTPEWWSKHGELDRKRTRYEELLRSDSRPDEQELTPEVYRRKYDAVQEAVGHLGAILGDAGVDAVIVVGDDQGELFSEGNMPAIAMYWGDTVLDIPRDMSDVPASRAAAMWAKHAEQEEAYPVASELGR